MKSIRLFLALLQLALVSFALTAVAVAQQLPDVPVDPADWRQLLPVIVAFAAPLLLGLVKKALLRQVVEPDGTVLMVLPDWFPKWLPMLLAPALIWGSDLLLQWLAGSPGVSPYLLMLLSPLPSFLRDIGDQIRKAKTGEATQVVKLVSVNPDRVLPAQR